MAWEVWVTQPVRLNMRLQPPASYSPSAVHCHCQRLLTLFWGRTLIVLKLNWTSLFSRHDPSLLSGSIFSYVQSPQNWKTQIRPAENLLPWVARHAFICCQAHFRFCNIRAMLPFAGLWAWSANGSGELLMWEASSSPPLQPCRKTSVRHPSPKIWVRKGERCRYNTWHFLLWQPDMQMVNLQSRPWAYCSSINKISKAPTAILQSWVVEWCRRLVCQACHWWPRLLLLCITARAIQPGNGLAKELLSFEIS